MKTLSLRIILLAATLWLPHSAHAAKNILVFGDSLSAGYGIMIDKGWVKLLQQELNDSNAKYKVVNASISGETTSGGRQRIAKALQRHRPAIVIVELGANDGLRGHATMDIESNLGAIITQAKRAGAKVLLIGMEIPPNYGSTYTRQFRDVYPRLARKYNVALLPFLLEGVPADGFQADNLHPVANAQPRIMRNVMTAMEPLLSQD